MHNIVLLTVDCLRADRLGSARDASSLAPYLDGLAGHSSVFTEAFAVGPRTAESFPAILTSTYPLAFGGSWRLPEARTTLAETLQRAGFATAAFHSNPYLSTNLGYGKGFDRFWDSMEATPAVSKLAARVAPLLKTESPIYRFLRRLIRRFETQTEATYYTRAEEVNARAVSWLSEQQDPFFLWLHYMDLHYPFNPPSSFVQRIRPAGIPKAQQADIVVRSLEDPASVTEDEAQILKDLYDAGLLYVDQSIGQLIDTLRELELYDDTLMLVTADHGEEFREHGDFGHGADIHRLKEGQPILKLYDELLHVPLLVRVPDGPARARRISGLVSLIDLAPTVVDLLGLEAVTGWQGRSLAPLLHGETDRVRAGVFSEYAVQGEAQSRPIIAYRTEDWKLIYDGVGGKHELYDLARDRGERNNVYELKPPTLKTLEQAVQKHLAEVVRMDESEPDAARLTSKVAERLKGLGYIE
ncbi:MAG: sulfatase [Anaerolineae bacterium]